MRYGRIARRRAGGGFTLIELLIVVAIIGVIAAILIPNLLDTLQKAKQKRTMADMRDVGLAWFDWLTDQTSAAAAGQSVFDFDVLTVPLTRDQLMSSLYINSEMFYTREIAANDGWGHLYDFRYSGNPSSARVIGIRSRGRDGSPEGPVYTTGPFLASDYDQDIVWTDGFFVRFPSGARVD